MHIDGVLRSLALDLDPETMRPRRAYHPRDHYFARNELSRICQRVLRIAAGELLSTDDIAGRVIVAKAWMPGTRSCARQSGIRSGRSSSGCIGAATLSALGRVMALIATIFHSRKLPPRDYLAAIAIFVNAVKVSTCSSDASFTFNTRRRSFLRTSYAKQWARRFTVPMTRSYPAL
jgi:hypothetical protein